MILYRPVGQTEYELIQKSGYKRFPPRLEWQPIFYPVLNIEYARQIAESWNTKDEFSGYTGYVLKFEINDSYAAQFQIHTVGASYHQELWIPAEDLSEFNSHIKGLIRVIEKYSNN